jgi:L-ribulose-5-phosphate 4-epimerase
MTAQEARETVVLAGRKLVESGLIARTWGNVSCRISDSHFVITPSGRDYLSLKPEEIVEVAVSDCSYNSSIKPSSEKGVHAEVYKQHPEINFVIHTHQEQASSVSALMLDTISVSQDFPSLGGKVLCAAYGLPGTKKLRRSVAEALSCSKGKAVIMKNHGAICFGTNYEEAFRVAHELENACKRFIQDQYAEISNKHATDISEILFFALSKLTGKVIPANAGAPLPAYESERTKSEKTESERTEYGFRPQIPDKRIADIHLEIYKKHKNINHIIHAGTPGIMAVSCSGIKLLPFLDDFAQIAGTSVKNVELNSYQITNALKSASAVLLQNNGALCCGNTKEDALAVGMVLEKNCKTLAVSALLGRVKPINWFECCLMRFVYMKKYSKLKIETKNRD